MDLNDHEELRHDPMFALALGKRIGQEDKLVILASHIFKLKIDY